MSMVMQSQQTRRMVQDLILCVSVTVGTIVNFDTNLDSDTNENVTYERTFTIFHRNKLAMN